MSDRGQSDRGQFILLTAIVFAVALIGMVSVGNLAVVTVSETAAGPDRSGDTIAGDVVSIERTAARALQSTNSDPAIFTESGRRTTAVERIEHGGESYATAAAFADTRMTVTVEPGSVVDGERIAQTSPAELTNASGAADWEPVGGATDVRVATFDFSQSGNESRLRTTANPDTTAVPTIQVSGQVNGSAAVMDVELYETPGGIATARYTWDSETHTCEQPVSDPVRISLVNGKLTGGECPSYPTFAVVDGIEIEHGDKANGTYAIVGTSDIGLDGDVSPSTTAPAEGDATDPVQHHAIYAVTVTTSIRSPEGRMNRTRVIAPGTSTPEGAI